MKSISRHRTLYDDTWSVVGVFMLNIIDMQLIAKAHFARYSRLTTDILFCNLNTLQWKWQTCDLIRPISRETVTYVIWNLLDSHV